MIGVGILTYNREVQFQKIVDSVKLVDHIVAVKDFGMPRYRQDPNCDFYQLQENKGIGFCKNLAIDALLQKGCEHIILLEDDCLVTDNAVWQYCIDFSHESGLLHFNWNDYRYRYFADAQFLTKMAKLSHYSEGNFSYFHKDFLSEIRFDLNYMNAWEHVDLEKQGDEKGFLPPFGIFISPANLGRYLRLIDEGESTISGKPLYEQRVIEGHHYFKSKWGHAYNDMPIPTMDDFYEKMKNITIKYGKRN